MALVVSIPDEYVKKAIEITGEYEPKKAILKMIDLAYKEAMSFKTAKEISVETPKKEKKVSEDVIKRAISYARKILESQGYISTEQLEKVSRKFKVPINILIDELGIYEAEKGKYIPYKVGQ